MLMHANDKILYTWVHLQIIGAVCHSKDQETSIANL